MRRALAALLILEMALARTLATPAAQCAAADLGRMGLAERTPRPELTWPQDDLGTKVPLPNGWTTSLTESSGQPLPGGTQTQEARHDASGWLMGGAALHPTLYDANGNLTQDAFHEPVVNHYQYAYASYPNEVSSVDGLSSVSCAYTYTGAGGVKTIAQGSAHCLTAQYTYDAANRVHSIILGTGSTVTMGYNAQGQRSRYQVTNAAGTLTLDERFGYSDGQVSLVQALTNDGQHCKQGDTSCAEVILYRPDGAPLELLYYGPGSSTPARYWYVVGGRGDVVALCSEAGLQLQRYQCDVWGLPQDNDLSAFYQKAVPQPLGYRGYVYDAETHTYWLGVRQYDPLLKRFLQPDPSEQDGVQSYVYCGDNPVDCSDPSGLMSDTGDLEGAAGAVGYVDGEVATLASAEAAVADGGQTEALPEYVGGSGYYSTGAMEPYEREVPAEGVSFEPEAGPAPARGATRTYQTYTKTNPATGHVYAGRTSGFRNAAGNLLRRDSSHAYTAKGYGPATLDLSSTNGSAIRGREQQLIEYYRNLGISGNVDNGVGPRNGNRSFYLQEAEARFGVLP